MIHGERDFALSISYHTWGLVIIAAATLLTLALYVRRPGVQALLLAAFTLTLGVFVLMTRQHERYLHTALMVATLIGALRLRFIWYYLALSLTHLLNIGIVYERFYSGPGFELIDESLVVRAIAAVNVAALAVAFYALATQGSDRISAESSPTSSAL